MAVTALFFVVVVAVSLIRAYAEIDERFVERWAGSHGLALTPVNRPMVWWYLRTARVLRTVGALGGLIVPMAVNLALTQSGEPPGGLLWLFAGYFVGALYAEVSLVRPRSAVRRTAILETRRVEQYLPRRLLLAQRTIAVAGVLAAAGVAVLPFDETFDAALADGPLFIAMALVAAVVGACLPIVESWLVRRPQPWVDDDLVAADDAIRSQSVHSLAGSGIAVALCLLGPPLWTVAQSDVDVLAVLSFPAALCFPAAIVACLYYGHRAWRVPRRGGDRPPAVVAS